MFDFNPAVAIHELRMRMRGSRPFVMLLAGALLASMAVLITLWYLLEVEGAQYGASGSDIQVGRWAFYALAYTLLTLVLFSLPVYAAASVSSEREKGTLDMLRATLLSPSDVVSGKLLVVLAFGGVVLVTTLPVAAWCVLLGGIEPGEIARVYVYLCALAFGGISLGVLISCWRKRSAPAISETTVLMGVWCVGPPLFTGMLLSLQYAGGGGGSPSNIVGELVAAVVFVLWALASAWLLFVGLRWLLPKLAARPRGPLATWLAFGGTAAALVWFVARFADAFLYLVSNARTEVLFVGSPYVAMFLLLQEDAVGDLIRSAGGSGAAPASAADLQTLAWLISTGAVVLMALALWALAVRVFRARW